jgi:hypothetical protein
VLLFNVYCCKHIFRYRLSPETFGYTLVCSRCFNVLTKSTPWSRALLVKLISVGLIGSLQYSQLVTLSYPEPNECSSRPQTQVSFSPNLILSSYLLTVSKMVYSFRIFWPKCCMHFSSFSFRQGARIAQLCSTGLRAGWSGVWVPVGAGNFSLHLRVQTGSGFHPAFYPMGTRYSFPGDKAAGRQADHSPPFSAEVKKAWSHISTPPIRLHGVVLS